MENARRVFVMEIPLHKAEMQTGDDLKQALQVAADRIDLGDKLQVAPRSGDLVCNGERVGRWKLVEFPRV